DWGERRQHRTTCVSGMAYRPGLLAPGLAVSGLVVDVLDVVVLLVHARPADARRVRLGLREGAVQRVHGRPSGPAGVDDVDGGDGAVLDQSELVREALATHDGLALGVSRGADLTERRGGSVGALDPVGLGVLQ